MKKLFVAVVLIIALASPSYAVNFVEIGRDSRYVVFIDTDSIARRDYIGNQYYIVAWVKRIPRGETAEERKKEYKADVDYEIDLFAINNDVKQFQVLSWLIYDKNGNALDQRTRKFSPINYDEVTPGTLGELIYNTILEEL